MKIACGTDIIEIDRIKKAIDDMQDKFLNKIFTKEEIDYCEKHKDNKYEHYAARFAVKEATYKAANKIAPEDTIDWQKYFVVNLDGGKPEITIKDEILKGRIVDIDVSISHCKDYAMATTVIIYD